MRFAYSLSPSSHTSEASTAALVPCAAARQAAAYLPFFVHSSSAASGAISPTALRMLPTAEMKLPSFVSM